MGASQVCTALDDIECYGNFYQWGRDNADFDVASDYPYDWVDSDDDGSLRVASWRKTDGSSICPVGYRVPTITELAAETTLADNSSGSTGNQGFDGFVWSSSATGSNSNNLNFNSSNANTNNNNRTNGGSVRCIKD